MAGSLAPRTRASRPGRRPSVNPDEVDSHLEVAEDSDSKPPNCEPSDPPSQRLLTQALAAENSADPPPPSWQGGAATPTGQSNPGDPSLSGGEGNGGTPGSVPDRSVGGPGEDVAASGGGAGDSEDVESASFSSEGEEDKSPAAKSRAIAPHPAWERPEVPLSDARQQGITTDQTARWWFLRIARALELASRGAPPAVHPETFDSAVIPSLPMSRYVAHIGRHFNASIDVFLAALIYLDNLARENVIVVSPRNVHRLFLGAAVVAAKFWEDGFLKNSHYGLAGGVRLAEMNRLESKMLLMLRWHLTIDPATLVAYRQGVGNVELEDR
mmetsp:Transcript_116459/g.267389  ORF Transcript_116459/g.267389 Transcript_116459/m.267389 type:complete len:327 (-) Transcript_116459:124-1104(-)